LWLRIPRRKDMLAFTPSQKKVKSKTNFSKFPKKKITTKWLDLLPVARYWLLPHKMVAKLKYSRQITTGSLFARSIVASKAKKSRPYPCVKLVPTHLAGFLRALQKNLSSVTYLLSNSERASLNNHPRLAL